jgi:riboflavin kinase/FMN adenylyltransferase
MPDRVRIDVLGTGTSVGVPSIGCDCPVCTSADPRDKRLRASVLLRYNGRNVLIDAGPDLRQQLLRVGLTRLDAILFTHAHADHILGLDDVRPFNFRQRQAIPIYGTRETIATIRQVFRYIFETLHSQSTIPRVEVNVIDGEPFDLFGLKITPVPVKHGSGDCLGYRFGSGAYLTDHSTIPPESMKLLTGLDALFLDALRHRDHPTHSTVRQSLDTVAELLPLRTYFTHISHELLHEDTERSLPSQVAIAFDGLALDVAAREPARVARSFGDPWRSPCALTIGNFDGVHRGHAELMHLVAQRAGLEGWAASALTFDPHPARIVAPERAPRLLTSIEERCRLMTDEGIEQVFVLAFEREIAALPPEDFVERILVRGLGARHIVVGEDFRFGAKQAGDVALLESLSKRLGFGLQAIRKIDSHRQRISSTAIRRHLDKGEVSAAAQALGRPYALEGEVVRGYGIGSKQTVPTLNLAWTAPIVPARGVYVTRTRDTHSLREWPSVTNVGFRPTFEGQSLSIETFLLSPLEGATPRRIAVEFRHRLRDERKFDDPAALREQILRDVARANAYHRRVARWVQTVRDC